MSTTPDVPLSAASLAEVERELGRQQRELAGEQQRLADFDDTPIGDIRRRAADFHNAAAVVHERAADEIDGGGDVEA